MAERMLVAFGRYLRMLRERKGLSLEDVALVTKPYPEPVSKGYLSRVENGHTKIGFSKMIALSRAYDVPLGVVAERHSLDLELEKMGGGPDTKGKTLAELRALGRKARDRGLRWEAYAYLRDSLPIAMESEVLPGYLDQREQFLATVIGVSTFANKLGRRRLALHDLQWVADVDGLGSENSVLLMHQLSSVHRGLGHLDDAQRYAIKCLDSAKQIESQFLPHAFENRAVIAAAMGNHRAAIADYTSAYKIHNSLSSNFACATVQLNIANSYVEIGRLGAARRSLAAVEKVASRDGIDSIRARCRLLLGQIEAAEGRRKPALTLWREAIELARRCNDKTIVFVAEFLLYRDAVGESDWPVARALGRRLNRLAPWIPPDVVELEQFRHLFAAQPAEPRRKRVSRAQPQNS